MRKFWLLGLFFFATSLLYADRTDQIYLGYGIGTVEYGKGAFNDDEDIELLSLGYEYSDFYSVEFSYIDLGTVRDRYFPPNVVTLTPDILQLETKGITIAPAFEWDLSGNWSVAAKIGLSVFDIDKRWSGGTVVDEFYANDIGGTETELFYGFRLQYDISDDMSLELNWDKYDIESIDADTVYAKFNLYF